MPGIICTITWNLFCIIKKYFIIIESDFSEITDRVTAFQEYFEHPTLENSNIGKKFCDVFKTFYFFLSWFRHYFNISSECTFVCFLLFCFECLFPCLPFIRWALKKKINKAWGQMFPPELLLMSIADDTSVRWDKANNTPLGLLSSSWTSSTYSYRHSWCTEFLKTGFTSFQQET